MRLALKNWTWPSFRLSSRQKAVAEIDVFGRFRQTRPDHQHPAGNGRRDEQFVFARLGQAFLPRTSGGAIQVKGGLNEAGSLALTASQRLGCSKGEVAETLAVVDAADGRSTGICAAPMRDAMRRR